LCFIVIPGRSAFAQNKEFEEAVRSYIATYREIAIKEMMEYRIPASIILAQGIYESNAGKSRLSTEANNHFGIKCHKDWNGETFSQDDETKNECFRKYSNPEESFRDHSIYLSQHDRYKSLFNLEISDYKGWANGLKTCGYATNPQYAYHLIKTIEDYQLYQLDVADFSLVFNDSVAQSRDSNRAIGLNAKFDLFAEGPGKRMVYLNNGLQFIIFRKNDNIKNVAKAFHVAERKIRKFNDMKKDAPLVPGQMVYLEPKKRKGAISRHIVKPGETLYTISQSYGIQLSQLYKINKLKTGQPVYQGQKVLLR
jgi:LysM repeat protein